MLVGLPASGKSTWAKKFTDENENVKRISKNDLRSMLQNGRYSPELEKDILLARDNLIINFIMTGRDVVVDDTNMNPKHQDRIKELANNLKAELVTKSFLTDVDLCVSRDSKRINSVGEKAIRDMYEKYKDVYDRYLVNA